jgi:hypothetical protein
MHELTRKEVQEIVELCLLDDNLIILQTHTYVYLHKSFPKRYTPSSKADFSVII